MLSKQTRRLLAVFLALGSGVSFPLAFASAFDFVLEGPASPAAIVGGMCIVGALALRCRSVGGQIVARGAIWSGALFQLLIVHLLSFDRHPDVAGGTLMLIVGSVVAACGSLLLAGRPDHHSLSSFRPVAHLGTLTAALILAVADTLSLLFWGSLAAQGGAMDTALGLVGLGGLMSVGVFGLLRLRTWALLLNLISNMLIASVAALELIDVGPLALVLITTAALQLLVATPIVLTILRPDWRVPSWLTALGVKLPAASLFAVVLLALQPLLSDSILIKIAVWAGY